METPEEKTFSITRFGKFYRANVQIEMTEKGKRFKDPVCMVSVFVDGSWKFKNSFSFDDIITLQGLCLRALTWTGEQQEIERQKHPRAPKEIKSVIDAVAESVSLSPPYQSDLEDEIL